jgi:hypothetical protein
LTGNRGRRRVPADDQGGGAGRTVRPVREGSNRVQDIRSPPPPSWLPAESCPLLQGESVMRWRTTPPAGLSVTFQGNAVSVDARLGRPPAWPDGTLRYELAPPNGTVSIFLWVCASRCSPAQGNPPTDSGADSRACYPRADIDAQENNFSAARSCLAISLRVPVAFFLLAACRKQGSGMDWNFSGE